MLKIRRKIVAVFLMIFLFMIGLELIHSKYLLEVSYYKVNLEFEKEDSSTKNRIRIIQLTDLHDSVFGIKNEKLISMVLKENPDVIFITGDLVDSHKNTDTIRAQDTISRLVKIAPTYISLGNQELSLMGKGAVDIISDYERAGATVLEYSYVDVEIKGDRYRIGGLYGYCHPVAYAKEVHRENESEFLIDFQNTDACKLLLCHMPTCWINSYSLYDWDVDVVFSGHVHGGQIRIPYIGGLWAPDLGWFPGELSGIYTTNPDDWEKCRKKLLEFSNQMHYDTSYYEEHNQYSPSYLVLSRGLGNTDWLPRFNNAPEIVVVDLIPGE